HLEPAKTTVVYETYWRFAAERQAIFFKRIEGAPFPWTSDPILKRYKFTNAYRASDRVSQYLIRNVIYEGDSSTKEVFFRIMLFKLFNRIETWKLLEEKLGEITYEDYAFEKYNEILTSALARGRIFSGAYIMPSGRGSFGYRRKHRNILRLVGKMMEDNVPVKISDAESMQQVFEILRGYPMIGEFLAYQFATDINYSEITNFKEMDFVVPGPGARDGIRKCFESLGGLNEAEMIRLMADKQEEEFDNFGLDFRSLWGRPLQLVDCQNLFCEVDKYARLAHPEVPGRSKRKQIKQMYKVNPTPINYWYPPKWGINERVISDRPGGG
ncbi:MAG: nucleotide kinase domain-containing protein, partial [Planctomycetota bacterium]